MEIQIHDEYITLAQLLKLANIAQSGGEAKFLVKELTIFVDNEKENRRGKKVYKGSIVQVDEIKIKVI